MTQAKIAQPLLSFIVFLLLATSSISHASEQFEIVLSFANHATFDENTKQDLESYFSKCRKLLSPKGYFLFESHPPHLEKMHGNETLGILAKHFDIVSQTELN